MTEEAGEEDLDQEDDERHPEGPGDIDVGEGVAEAGEKDDEKAAEEDGLNPAGKLERDDDGDEVNRERQDPEQRDGGDVGGEEAGYGAELHGGPHGE